MGEPDVPQKRPYVQEAMPKTYAWCACGKSQQQPFCDGSHKGTVFSPVIAKIEETKTVEWCGCKHTKTAPFCDGSHKQL